jgi:hypothetical protein
VKEYQFLFFSKCWLRIEVDWSQDWHSRCSFHAINAPWWCRCHLTSNRAGESNIQISYQWGGF